MSKMSQLHAELTEQAARLGFESIEEAEAHGYVVDYESHELVDGQEQAHKDWLEERDEVFEMIDNMKEDIIDSVAKKEGHPRYWVDTLERIRAFIEKGEI